MTVRCLTGVRGSERSTGFVRGELGLGSVVEMGPIWGGFFSPLEPGKEQPAKQRSSGILKWCSEHRHAALDLGESKNCKLLIVRT